LDFLVYQICSGDLTKSGQAEEFTLEDAVLWLNLNAFEGHIQEQMMKEK